MRRLSLERSIGRAILSDPLLEEAFLGFATENDRHEPNAAKYLVRRSLQFSGWLVFDGNDWIAGPRLDAFRKGERLHGEQETTHAGSEHSTAQNVVPFRPPLGKCRRQSDGFPVVESR